MRWKNEKEKFKYVLRCLLLHSAPNKETYDLFNGIYPKDTKIDNPFKLKNKNNGMEI